MTEQLDPTGGPVTLGFITLRTPGLSGTAESLHVPPAHAQNTRAMGGALGSDALEQALADADMITQHAIRLDGTREQTTRAPVTRSTRSGDAAMELEVPAPGPDMEQVVLYQDESGLHSWVFAEHTSQQRGLTTRGTGATRTYLLRRHVPQVEAQPGQRGLIGAIGHKILRVLLFPIVRAGARLVGPAALAVWEKHKRSSRLRTFTCQNAAHNDDVPSLEPGSLDRFANQPILLLIHGTFSRTPSAFGELSAPFIDKLNAKYQGAVVSFDHPTLSQDPAQNVEQLFSLLAARRDLTVDIVCHSRGGLVARELAARGPARATGKVKVRNLVFVATPNAGTVLAQAEHVGDMIDAYTNLLHFLPGIGVADVLATVITVVKEVAVGLDEGLPGLQSMNSKGKYLPNLTWPAPFAPQTTYGLASNYTPIKPVGFANYTKNFLLDRIFREANDLVVPTDGVFAQGVGIQPTCSMTYGADEGIAHTTFFKHQKVLDQLQTWLAL
jgi:pimeloyl-ACP methyl ester carboxylesterase